MTADYIVFTAALAVIAAGVVAAVVWQLRKNAAVAPFRVPRPRQEEALNIVWHQVFRVPPTIAPPPIHWITSAEIEGEFNGSVIRLNAPEGALYSQIPFAHELRHAKLQRLGSDILGDVLHRLPGWERDDDSEVHAANAALEAAGL